MKQFNSKISIIVYSCYKNRDMWKTFSFFYKKYAQDCNFKIVLATDKYCNDETFVFDDVVELDSNWSEMVKAAIACAGTPYVMLFMDDYLLTAIVDDDPILHIVDDMEKYKAQNIRLFNAGICAKKEFKLDKRYYEIIPGTAYSLTTQVGIWDSEFLTAYLAEKISPWEFERRKSMSCSGDNVLLLQPKNYVFPYVEAVRKGKWMKDGVKHCKINGYEVDYSARGKMSIADQCVSEAKGMLLRLAPNFIQSIQNSFLYRKR